MRVPGDAERVTATGLRGPIAAVRQGDTLVEEMAIAKQSACAVRNPVTGIVNYACIVRRAVINDTMACDPTWWPVIVGPEAFGQFQYPTSPLARPGGAQALFHAEMKAEEYKHKLELTAAAYRDYQKGKLPAGPGAKGLVSVFEHVDAELDARRAEQPTVVATDRHIELLLKKRADILHIQPANYCWFADPSKALCLILAGTPDADTPLAGMCDAARCPQATFHPEHRDTWAGCAGSTEAFLGNPRIPAGEKARLTAEHDRARKVIEAIDAATTAEVKS